jgi:glycine betaine/proline transport system substrate-binding protein
VVSACGSSSSNGGGGAASNGASGSGGTIDYAMNSFSDDRASTALATAVLEKAGYKVSPQLLGSVGLDFASVANGNAEVYSDAWLPYTHAEYWSRYGGKLEKLSRLYTSPVSTGLAVPKYCAAQSIDQLNSQASTYGNKIIGIEAGSGEMITTKHAVGDYGLKLTLVPGSETAMLATLKQAISQHRCEVVTLWRPHAAFALYPIRYLKDPKGLYKPEQAWTVANPSLKSKFPHAYAFLQQFTIPLSDQEKMINAIVNQKKTLEAAAEEWMAAHPAIAFAAIVHMAQTVPARFLRGVLESRDMVCVTTADGHFPVIDGQVVAPEAAGLGIEPRIDVLGAPVATYGSHAAALA